ncbi:MAG: hypothetical protein ACTSPY_16800 [Candidatus Helarchaeota archaeon]
MSEDPPLFIYFIPMIDEDNGDVIFSTTITEFEIENNKSDTAVIVMPNEFSIAIKGEEEKNIHPSYIVKMMFFNLIENFKDLLYLDKIIIFHNGVIDKYGDLLCEIRNGIFGQSSVIMDIIKISREFYKRLGDFIYTDERLFTEIRKFHKKMGLVDFDETDDLQKIIFDQLIKQRKALLERKKKIKNVINKITAGIIEKTFEIQANEKWEELKKKGKIIYYAPGILPIN